MRDIETLSASKFEAPHRPLASTPDASWHLNFCEIMAQFRRLGARALARQGASNLVRMPPAKIRQIECARDTWHADAPNLLRLGASQHEFAAFAIRNSRGQTLVECALHEADALPPEVRAYLPALAESTWELYEVMERKPALGFHHGDGPQPVVRLRRLYDDAFFDVHALESGACPQLGEVGGWRIFDAGGFLAAPRALPIPRDIVVSILSQLNLEASKWSREAGGCKRPARHAYMRARGNLLMLNHCVRSAKHRLCDKDAYVICEPASYPAGHQRAGGLVSPAESDLPADYWRRLAQAFSVLEISASGRPKIVYPHPFAVSGGQILCLEEAAGAWMATLFESASAHQEWTRVQQSLTGSIPTRAVAHLRCWRAHADDLGDRDIEFLRALHLKPRQNGVALGVRLSADWSWQDLDPNSMNQLIDALHTASKQLRTGEGLAA